jgi:hypothetical protein
MRWLVAREIKFVVVFLVTAYSSFLYPSKTLAERHFCATFWFGHGFGALDMGILLLESA